MNASKEEADKAQAAIIVVETCLEECIYSTTMRAMLLTHMKTISAFVEQARAKLPAEKSFLGQSLKRKERS